MRAAKSSPPLASCAMSAAVKFLFSPRRESEEVESRIRRSRVRRTMFGAEATVSRQPTLPHTQTTPDRKSTRLNSSHANISYAVFCLKKKKKREYMCHIRPAKQQHQRDRKSTR